MSLRTTCLIKVFCKYSESCRSILWNWMINFHKKTKKQKKKKEERKKKTKTWFKKGAFGTLMFSIKNEIFLWEGSSNYVLYSSIFSKIIFWKCLENLFNVACLIFEQIWFLWSTIMDFCQIHKATYVRIKFSFVKQYLAF